MDRRTALHFLAGTVIALLLAGCGGPDDLQVTNRYPFAVQLKKHGDLIGTVEPGQTQTFSGKGGLRGEAADGISCVDAQGKSLGSLAKAAHDVQRENNGGFNGSGVLTAILGP